MLEDPEYAGVLRNVESYFSYKASFELKKQIVSEQVQNIMRSLSTVERILATSIRFAIRDNTANLENRLKNALLEMLSKKNPIEKVFISIVKDTTFVDRLAVLIRKYGNGVWATTIISALIPAILKEFRPDIIVTNPPWVLMTKYQAQYVSNIRNEAMKILNKMISEKRKGASIVTGSDVACMAFYKSLQIAREGVGFVMNREQSFYSRSSMRAGILLIYVILNEWMQKERGRTAELIDVDYDAFGHGIYPALIKAWQTKEG